MTADVGFEAVDLRAGAWLLRASWAHDDGHRYDEHLHGRLASDPHP